MTPLGPRDRRALAVGMVLLGPALLWGAVLRPYARALAETRAQAATQRGLLAREHALLRDAHRYPGLIRGARHVLAEETPRLFTGPDPLAAASALEGYLAERAAPNRVLLDRSESRTADSVALGVTALQADVHGTGDLQGILGYVRALETGPRLVRVERLSIERATAPDGGPEEVLSFGATFVGYTLAALEHVGGTEQE